MGVVVGVGDGVGLGEGVGLGVGVGEGVGLGEGVGDGLGVGVAVGAAVGIGVGEKVGAGDAVLTLKTLRFCGSRTSSAPLCPPVVAPKLIAPWYAVEVFCAMPVASEKVPVIALASK